MVKFRYLVRFTEGQVARLVTETCTAKDHEEAARKAYAKHPNATLLSTEIVKETQNGSKR